MVIPTRIPPNVLPILENMAQFYQMEYKNLVTNEINNLYRIKITVTKSRLGKHAHFKEFTIRRERERERERERQPTMSQVDDGDSLYGYLG